MYTYILARCTYSSYNCTCAYIHVWITGEAPDICIIIKVGGGASVCEPLTMYMFMHVDCITLVHRTNYSHTVLMCMLNWVMKIWGGSIIIHIGQYNHIIMQYSNAYLGQFSCIENIRCSATAKHNCEELKECQISTYWYPIMHDWSKQETGTQFRGLEFSFIFMLLFSFVTKNVRRHFLHTH